MTSYNGWTNYETWCVNLWISNDEGSSRYWDEMSRECWENALCDDYCQLHERNRQDVARYSLAELLKDVISEENPLADDAGMFSDLLGAALCDVNWDEIAANMLEEIQDE